MNTKDLRLIKVNQVNQSKRYENVCNVYNTDEPVIEAVCAVLVAVVQ